MNREPPRSVAFPVSLPILFERCLIGSFVALMVARPLVAGDDPGRLRLTSGGGSVSLNFFLLLVLLATALWQAVYARTRSTVWAVVPILAATVGVVAFVSSQLGDRYARPGLFIAWEWVAVAIASYLAYRLFTSESNCRGLINAMIASAVSVAGLGIHQSLTEPLGLPTLDVTIPFDVANQSLAGDDEFYPQLNRPAAAPGAVRGTFDSPATLLVFLVLAFPAAAAIGSVAWRERRRWLMVLPILIAAAVVAAIAAQPFASKDGRGSDAVLLIKSQPWFGVGPGNFTRMSPNAAPPTDFWSEVSGTMGIVGLLAVGASLLLAVSRFRPSINSRATEPLPAGRRWEFHLGGAAGLVLGFIWAQGDVPVEAPPSEIFKLGTVAVFRAILWFAAFALLETVRPSSRALGFSVLTGAGMIFALGIFSVAPGRPTILVPLFVLLTVAANLMLPPTMRPDGPRSGAARVVTVLLAAGLAIAYLVTACVPAWATASAVRQARMASRHFPEREREVDRARAGPPRANALTNARGFLLGSILHPLLDAADRDRDNAALWLEIARWQRPLWRFQLIADPENAARVADETRKAAEFAAKLDPHNLAAKRNLFEAMLLYRRESRTREPERTAALNKLIGQIAEKEPASEVPLRYRVVRMLLDRHDYLGARAELALLRRLNDAEGAPHGKVTHEQLSELTQRFEQLEEERLREAIQRLWP
jgi:hypothetical protein